MKKIKITRTLIFTIILFLGVIILKTKQFITNKPKDNIKIEKVSQKYTGKVTDIIDSNTIEICFLKDKPFNLNQKIRISLLGCCKSENTSINKETLSFLKNEILNQYVDIQFDGNIDKEYPEGYVYIDSYLLNQILIERGYSIFSGKDKCSFSKQKLFDQAETYAKLNEYGVWKTNGTK